MDGLKHILKRRENNVIIAIDEAQFLRKEVLREFIMLMNFDYDSKDYCTLIFVGQNEFLRTLRLKALEPLRQRINMNYTFTG
ncbi:AAA family ATPase, partial [Catenibacterium mitsuokai]|uniref:AAA family ATPase n=2 Tax=Catenibacterium mitsuokai TaxID=100886 RepID=UPI003F91F06C